MIRKKRGQNVWVLIFSDGRREEFRSRSEAEKRERQVLEFKKRKR